jgi:hypothetical protein
MSDPGPDTSRDVGAIVARLVSDDEAAGGGRRRELRSLTGALATSARTAGRASVLGGRWLTDLLIDVAPRLPLRDLSTLRAQHPGLPDEDLAEILISGAAKATGAVGAAGGALAAVEFAAPPTLLTTPFQIGAETLLIAAIEVKLIAELHEVYGATATGSSRERGAAYLAAWTNRHALDPRDPRSQRISLGPAAKVALRRRLIRRAGRNLSTMGPLMSGAIAGSVLNHRETRKLGDQIRADLRRR